MRRTVSSWRLLEQPVKPVLKRTAMIAARHPVNAWRPDHGLCVAARQVVTHGARFGVGSAKFISILVRQLKPVVAACHHVFKETRLCYEHVAIR